MRKRWRAFAVAACALATVTAPGMSANAATGLPGSSLASFNFDDLAQATQNDVFDGYSVSEETKTVSIYATSAASASDAAVVSTIAMPAGFVARIVPVSRSWSSLSTLEEQLPTRLPAQLRPLLSRVNIDQENDGLDVGLTDVPAGAQESIDEVFGKGLIRVSQREQATDLSGSVGSATDATGQRRDYEKTGPWHAGAPIEAHYTSSTFDTDSCTAGFVILIGGVKYGTTAGHCGTGGGTSEVDASNGVVGNVVHRSYNDNAWDTEYYSGGGNLSTAMWILGPQSSTGVQVKGTFTPGGSTTVYGDGAVSGQQVTSEQANGGICQTFTNRRNGVSEYVCGLGAVQNASGRVCAEGDSGGPIFYESPSSSLYFAVGNIVGSDSNSCYYQTIAKVLSHWGASIATG